MNNKVVDPGSAYYRFLIYGRSKMGKTTFGASAPNVLIIDPEAGTKALRPRDGLKVWHVPNWEEMEEVNKFLRDEAHGFEWVVLDGMTRFHNMALRFVMKQQEQRDLDRIPNIVQQRDYGKAGELLKGLIYNLQSLPMGVVFTAQERMDTGAWTDDDDDDAENPEVRLIPDLPKGVRSTITAVVDGIGRIYTVPIEANGRKGMARRLYIAPSPTLDTGFRSSSYKGNPPYLKKPTVMGLITLLNGDTE